jgi:hypothetical protein
MSSWRGAHVHFGLHVWISQTSLTAGPAARNTQIDSFSTTGKKKSLTKQIERTTAMYVIIEMIDVDIICVRAFGTFRRAMRCFEEICEENKVDPYPEQDLDKEAPGTIALAGDDAYAVQVIEVQGEVRLPRAPKPASFRGVKHHSTENIIKKQEEK